jgi:hypothetical protein
MGDLRHNSKWKHRRVRDIAILRTGSPAPQEARYFEGGCYPFVRVQDLGRYGRTESLTETKDRINDLASRQQNLWVNSGSGSRPSV